MKNFIDLCRLIEPAKRAGYYLSVHKSNGGTSVSMFVETEGKIGDHVYYLSPAPESELSEALVAVRGIINRPTSVYPNGEHLEFDGVDIVVSSDWQNGEMFVTAEGDIFNLMSNEQLNRIMEQLGGFND
jgi:hypothetical protein